MAKPEGGIDSILSKGDVLGGHRTRSKAKTLVPDLIEKLGLTKPDAALERKLEDFVIDVILGAAWYTRKYQSARNKARWYVAANALLVVAIPLALFYALNHVASGQFPTSVAQLSGMLTGVFALQKTLSAWYAQQQQYATWYQCASDLKQVYYDLLHQHGGTDSPAALAADLDAGADRARKVMDAERLGFYQRLALPTMDVLDMLTGSSEAVTKLITGLMPVPGARGTASVAIGTKTVADAVVAPTSAEAGPSASKSLVQDVAFGTGAALPDFNADTVAKCASMPVANAADLTALFVSAGGFFAWYNRTLSATTAFEHRGKARDDAGINQHFVNFWDKLNIAFGTDKITLVEFCALMSVNMEETTGDLTAAPEEVNGMHHPHPGLAYAFDRIAGLKQSYNQDPNKTALQLFNDHDFVAVHGGRPGADAILRRHGGIDPAWGGDTWPSGFDATPQASVNGFAMQADFFKFRGRGVIQTTWRSDYKGIVQFILSGDIAGRTDLLNFRQQWEAAAGTRSGDGKLEFILTISRTEDWDRIFSDPLILSMGVHIDSSQKGGYLTLSHDVDVLTADRRTHGSLLRMASTINGGDYPGRVVPMMKTMMCGAARLVSSNLVAGRAPRVVEV